jgi:osmotically-inducible protein OsmY
MSPRAVADESSTGADRKEEQQIQAQFQKAPDLENNHIAVTVDDGIAVLEGTVDSQREKKEAQQLAHVDGILGVNNRLQVRGAGK